MNAYSEEVWIVTCPQFFAISYNMIPVIWHQNQPEYMKVENKKFILPKT